MRVRRYMPVGLVFLGLLLVSIMALEVYLRYTVTHIVRRGDRSLPGFAEAKPGLLIRYTSKGRRLVPNSSVVIRNHYLSKRDIPINTNSLGFRDEEVLENRKDNEIRILALGDSITWGDYLEEDEVYVERLERYLNDSIGDKSIEVINAGVGDIGLKEEIDILTEKGLLTQPDIVMIGFYLNDSRPPWGFPGELGRPGWLRRHSLLAQFIYGRLRLNRWIRDKGRHKLRRGLADKDHNWRDDRESFLEFASLANYDWGAAWEDDFAERIEYQFKRLTRLSETYGFRVVLVVFPNRFQVYARFIEDTPQSILKKIAADSGFHYFDVLPVLRSYNDRVLFFDNCHPRVETNDIIGKALSQFFIGEVLLNSNAN